MMTTLTSNASGPGTGLSAGAVGMKAGTPIGVDITARAIELCQMGRAGASGGAVFRQVRIPVSPRSSTDWDATFTRVAAIMRRRGFAGHRIVVAAPGDRCVSALLEMPHKTQDVPIARLVRMELAREHRVDAAGIESAWWDVPNPVRAGAGRPVMSVGCPLTLLRAMERGADAAGLEIVAIDSRALALARGVCADAPLGWQIVCDLSAGVPTVIIAHEGRVVIEHKACDITIDALMSKIAADCRCDPLVAQKLSELIPLRQPPDRRAVSFIVPRVGRAVREYIDAVVRGVGQCFQYHRHRYGQTPGDVARLVVGEPWLTERFLECMTAEEPEAVWKVVCEGHGVARGLAMWSEVRQ